MTHLMRTASGLALVAAASMLATGAMAADLGGNCCTDLEERVAELEATTARKGNRKVSLQVYGQVSESIIWWDDGAESNTYVQENNNIQNRIGFTGSAKITSDWSAGFKLELQIRAYRSSAANQLALGSSNNVTITAYNTQSVAIRHAHWFLRSSHYGTISVGRDFEASVGVSNISLVNPDGFSGFGGAGFANGGYFLRRAGTTGNVGLSAQSWQSFAYNRNGDGPVANDYAHTNSGIKYTSPFFLGHTKSSGFQFQSNWGMDDAWSVALRYAEEFGGFRVAAGVGYNDWTGADRGLCSTGASNVPLPGVPGPGVAARASDTDCQGWQFGGSLMHVATGLYVSGGALITQDDNLNVQRAVSLAQGNLTASTRRNLDSQHNAWYIQGGWQTKLNPLGNTIFWAQYVQHNTGTGVNNSDVQTVAATDVLNPLGATAFIAGSQTKIWGLGVSQNIDAAAMTLYMGFHNYSTEGRLLATNPQSTNLSAKTNAIDDMQLFYTGATIRF